MPGVKLSVNLPGEEAVLILCPFLTTGRPNLCTATKCLCHKPLRVFLLLVLPEVIYCLSSSIYARSICPSRCKARWRKNQLSVILTNALGELSKLCDVVKTSNNNILAMSIQNAKDSLKEL
jgi:hypothetical protein